MGSGYEYKGSTNTPISLRKRSLSITEPINDITTKHLLADPGNHPPEEHFKPRMSKFRYKIREILYPFVVNELPVLNHFQKTFRCKFLDEYFVNTANLGSHTFYVLCLPIPRWIGLSRYSRDLVFILGYSIYASGYCKDLWCLPRPKSPPIIRITHSEYTTKEYGAPSSHTANATGVTLFLLYLTFVVYYDETNFATKILVSILILLYYFTLTVGRIYTGMHGLLDIESGAIIGTVCFLIRLLLRDYVDNYLLNKWWFPLVSCLFGFTLLFTHVEPVDVCPCFEDSVAFIGVIGGLDFGDWLYPHIFKSANYELPYSYGNNIKITLLRVAVGVTLVVLWKSVLTIQTIS
ncbi:related to Dihydrosphingosine 1-phosphate phosphatase LCB3 [Saccharomycodes ludwigii]|uniref:Related to Dihydrosphingosine 1-phosphate phosphatase LCB3 n=1 Tax=Saccharomycodes ludwigii TaxID=36035 RepID=A0A376BBZ8_9ASCO|nr:related to Dihydrosphingosine 1-phosphate phosphatase LCB3 [Saccharomycodes ludwigii]